MPSKNLIFVDHLLFRMSLTVKIVQKPREPEPFSFDDDDDGEMLERSFIDFDEFIEYY